ncbi:MAG: glycoside hydrolase family 3 C-terminal domain-containing protein [Candidatus Hermodarchaeota archaeon]
MHKFKPYLNVNLPIEVRVEDLISRLTLNEKIAQLLNKSPQIERLNIPEYDWRNECLQGVAFKGIATIFPQAIAMAATWNPKLTFQVASAISDEARAKHHKFASIGQRGRWQGLTFSCPNINIFRDPRWGRGQETFGEDPYLTSKISVAFAKGLQGEHPQYLKVISEPKHFAVHSGPEKFRHEIDIEVNKKDLYETYLPAFRDCIQQAKVEGIMSAYNRLNGESCSASKTLLDKILRKEFGFEGYVIGDGGAITDIYKNHKIVDSLEQAVAIAINAGCDIINPMNLTTLAKTKKYRKAILNAIDQEFISLETIDKSLARTFRARFKLGMFDPPDKVPYTKIPYNVVNCEKHQHLALTTAQEAIVLLKNEDKILPLDKNLKSIAVIGPNADNPKALYYFHYYPGEYQIITPLEGIKQKVSSNSKVYYSKGCDLFDPSEGNFQEAIDIANKSEVIIMVLGITSDMEGEEGYVLNSERGDRTNLRLPMIQQNLLKTIMDINKNIVLVLTSGSCLSINYANENIPAILETWYSGEKGGLAIANVIFGDNNPAGRLPITFYKSIHQLPDFKNYSMQNRTYRYLKEDPLYSFGYGLSYSEFEYRNLNITPKKINPNDKIKLNFEVKNIGNFAGDEVVQLYIKHLSSDHRVPLIELKRFKRIHLKAEEIKTMSFTLTKKDLSIVDENGDYLLKSGEIMIFVGGCQPGYIDKNKIISSKLLIK